MARDYMWIQDCQDHYKLRCDRCESWIGVMLPAPMNDFIDFIGAYNDRHKCCRPTLRSARLELVQALHRRANPGGGSFTLRLGL